MQKQIADVIFSTTAATPTEGLSPVVALVAKNQEQVVFSGAAPGTFGGTNTISIDCASALIIRDWSADTAVTVATGPS
jgi:hypothetical protein